MIVTYWGVRGSLPVPGPDTVRYGGNTACVAVQLGSRLLVLDAGTGIRALGASLDGDVREIVLLLSHRHADHVQGLPFFDPLYEPGREIRLADHPGDHGSWSPLEVFDGVQVPMVPATLAPGVTRAGTEPGPELAEWGIAVETLALRHPGGSRGFRIRQDGRSFVHMTDNELEDGPDGEAHFQRCVGFCRGAQVLSHDAQYLRDEMPLRRGRGHSSIERVCELALAAGVERLVLFHHDPRRTDAQLDFIGQAARDRLRGSGIRCDVAYEGLRIDL